MPLVADLPLPELDVADPLLRGERWHAAMDELRDSGAWLARSPLATVVLDRTAGCAASSTRRWPRGRWTAIGP
jgi:hypothetical protein